MRCGALTFPGVTAQTLAGSAPAAAPAAIAPLSWFETAVAVLTSARRPLRAREIVELAETLGLRPLSRTQTPAQSINRDLHAAVRRGDTRVRTGPGPGEFRAAGVRGAPTPPAAPSRRRPALPSVHVPRLPVEPLVDLIDRQGGLRALGVRHRDGDPAEHVRWVERIYRSYLRCRERGWISIYDADEMSVKVLRLHPSQVWDDGWWDALESADAAPSAAQGQHAATATVRLAAAG